MASRKYSNETLEAIAEMRESGMSLGAIAKHFGVSRSVVSWHCLRLGADSPETEARALPPTPGPMVILRGGREMRRFTPEEDARLRRMAADGVRVSEMARALGRATSSIHGRLATLARHDERAQRAAERRAA